MATIEEKCTNVVLKAVARIFKKDVSELSMDTHFVEDLRAKSVNIVELIAVLENELDIMIPFADTRRRKTIGEAIDLVISLRKG